MIRISLCWLGCIALLGGCGNNAEAPVAPSEYATVSVDMTLERVSQHVWYVQGEAGVATDNAGFISNAALVITDDGIVIFDALGTPSLAHLLLEKVRRISPQPVRKVITSHYHADHIYGLQVFEEVGAQIIAPAGASTYLASEQARERLEERRFSLDPWVNDQTRLVAPDRIISTPESFEMGGVKFTLTPVGSAHSDGDLTLFVEPDRVLMSGDVIFEGRVPFLGDANSGRWLEILEALKTDGLTALIPGHGPAPARPAESIRLTRDYLAYLRQQMGRAVDDFVPFDEAYAATDWHQFSKLPAFTDANRRNAYQVFLSMEAESIGTAP